MTMDIRGVQVPSFLYGTAWKEERTEALVLRALQAGFRGIDTANQRKHYFEAGVGRALGRALREGRVRRAELFVQSKFTFLDGQDHRLPYAASAPVAEQVAQSLRSSLQHLGLDTLDSLVLHGPSQPDGFGPADREAWRAMEGLVAQGRVRLLGISNVTPRQVAELVGLAHVAPSFVQNRCYAEQQWDAPVRLVCMQHGIVYQGFSLLTANRSVLVHAAVRAIAARHQATPAQIVFRFAQQTGMLPLTGTNDATHMAQDLAVDGIELSEQEIGIVQDAGSA